MTPKLSIVMPSLNVADYIKLCMDSVREQTLSDLEIISIDAGSTDGTWEILQDYAKKDARICLVQSEKKSYGYQVNQGIALARGEYICIVETDDIVTPDMCEVLYHTAKREKADYVKGVSEGFFESRVGEDVRYAIKIFTQEQFDEHQGMITVIPRENPELVLRDYYLWNGIYQRGFLKDIRLNESAGAAYQDIGFMLQVHHKATKAVYLDKMVYNYRRNNLNASCSSANTKAFHYLVQEYGYVCQLLQNYEKQWHCVCYRKMLKQTVWRFRTMALTGYFWEKACFDIDILKKKIETVIGEGLLNKEDLTEKEWDEAMCLLRDFRLLYKTYAKQVYDKTHRVQEILDRMDDQKAVIFGCGKRGKFLHVLLGNQKPDQVVAYCDNRLGTSKMFVQGIPVLKPEEAIFRYPDAVYLIANRYQVGEMKGQLCFLGVKKENIIAIDLNKDMMLIDKFMS